MILFDKRKNFRSQIDTSGAFSMWDLIVILIVVAVLGGWFAFTHMGERGRVIRCTGNLRMLGQSMQSYAKDQDDSIPAATINLEKNHVFTWDMGLFPYLVPSLANTKSGYDKKELMQAAQPHFVCPSDPIQRKSPRSYAMSGFYMVPKNWPPSSNDHTGLGLVWDSNTVPQLLGSNAVQSAKENPDLLPRLKLSILPDPANTLLLTELITGNNVMGNPMTTRVFYTRQQIHAFNDDSSKFHSGKFNYLMADGHVALMSPSETGDKGDKQQAGIWAISGGN